MELTREYIEDLKEEILKEIIHYGNGKTVSFDTMFENNPINVFVQYETFVSNRRKGYERDGVGW